jgi:hypothetical protein
VLGDEDRMAPVGGLLPVLGGEGRREAPADQLVGVAPDALRPVELRKAAVAASQMESRAKRLAADAVEELVDQWTYTLRVSRFDESWWVAATIPPMIK